MGFKTWDDFYQQLVYHRTLVHQHFNHLLDKKDSKDTTDKKDSDLDQALQIIWQPPPEIKEIIKPLEKVGFDSPEQAAKALILFRDDFHTRSLSATGQNRLNRLMPLTLKAIGQVDRSSVVLDRILDLFKSIQKRTSYLALLLEYPAALSHLVQLAAASPWIVSFLSRHPVLLDELLDPRTLYSPPTRKELYDGLNQRLTQGPVDDFEYQMEVLRIFKQANTLRVAASDITSVLPLMNVSDRLSDIAEITLDQVVELSWQHLVQKHGVPQCELKGKRIEKGFAVIAYGKLGGLELGYGSDLDLVFLHCATAGQTQGGPKSIDNAQFFARLGQRVIHILSTHTAAGILYEVDMRLRPSGAAGVLVSHVNGYRTYQLEEAWTWEHQALIRARAICGNCSLMQYFEEIRKEVLSNLASVDQLKQDVAGMREKMRQQHIMRVPDEFDLKQGPGGMVDIEFLVQYLVLSNARRYPALLDWTDNVRLLQALTETGLIDELTAYRLRRAYLVYRAVIHRCNLQEKAAQISSKRFEDLKQWVQKIWEYFLKI
jgi:glutamate-ammonia-ligase adenylyltransferase